MLDKKTIIDAALKALASKLEAMRSSAEETRKGATHEESRPENDKDTRGLEASYLARGQALRVREMTEAMAQLRYMELFGFGGGKPIALSALVVVEAESEVRYLLLVPAGGGVKVRVDDLDIQLVTPQSPLGRALLHKEVGDVFELRVHGQLREYEVMEVS